jgi:hypothetical protein
MGDWNGSLPEQELNYFDYGQLNDINERNDYSEL